MLASLIVVFREVLEAGLIVGIVLAATQGIRSRGRWIAGGITAGVAGSLILAAFAGALSQAFENTGQEMFSATVLLLATAMLIWHLLWMASHGRRMAQQMRVMGAEVAGGRRSLLAVAVVVAIAVLREGAEVVLFLAGIATAANTSAAALVTGGALGIAAGATVSWLLYRGLLHIPLRHLFGVTGVLIALLAAGMAAQAAAILAGADLIPSWGYDVWNSSRLLPQNSLPGRALQVLVGYAERPMGIQIAAYVAVLGGVAVMSWLLHHPTSRTRHGSLQQRAGERH